MIFLLKKDEMTVSINGTVNGTVISSLMSGFFVEFFCLRD
jgi:hypothetical protein